MNNKTHNSQNGTSLADIARRLRKLWTLVWSVALVAVVLVLVYFNPQVVSVSLLNFASIELFLGIALFLALSVGFILGYISAIVTRPYKKDPYEDSY